MAFHCQLDNQLAVESHVPSMPVSQNSNSKVHFFMRHPVRIHILHRQRLVPGYRRHAGHHIRSAEHHSLPERGFNHQDEEFVWDWFFNWWVSVAKLPWLWRQEDWQFSSSVCKEGSCHLTGRHIHNPPTATVSQADLGEVTHFRNCAPFINQMSKQAILFHGISFACLCTWRFPTVQDVL